MADAAVRESDPALTLVLTRNLDAPREAVFKAWTDPRAVVRWFGPPGVQAEVHVLDVRPGGRFRVTMRGEDSGKPWTVGGVYREVSPPERLVFTWTWENTTPEHTGGHEMLVTVTFRAKGANTEMTLLQEHLESVESRDSHARGWGGSFDRLAELLRKEPRNPAGCNP